MAQLSEKDIELAVKDLETLRKQGTISRKTYDELYRRITANNGVRETNVKQLTQTDKILEETKDATKKFATNVLRGAQSVRKNREDFRSLNPAMKATGVMVGLAASSIGKMAETAGDAISTLSWFAGGFIGKLGGMAVGGLLTAAGKFFDNNAKELADLTQKFGQFALNQVQEVVESYRTIGSVGATTAHGMTGVYDDAIRAGMSIKEYSELIARQGQNLTKFAGTVTSGAEALGKVSQANEGYKEEYLKLGYTFTEQQEFTADYLKHNRVISGTSLNDTNKLAEGSRQYMDMLDDIARLTGQTRSEASKAMDAQESNLRFQASMREATRQSGNETIANNMRTMSEGIKTFGSSGLAEGFQDLTSGLGTKAAKDFNLATGGQGIKIAQMVKRGEIDSNKGMEMVQTAMKSKWESLGGDEFPAKVAKTGTVMDDSLAGMSRMVHAQELTAEGLEQQKQDQKDAKKTKDQDTKNIVSAQESMRKMAIDLDKIVKDRVFPIATQAVDKFTDMFVEFVSVAGEKLGLEKIERTKKEPEKPGVSTAPAAPAVPGGAAPSGPPEGQPQPGAAPVGPPGEGLTGKSLNGVNPALKGALEKVAAAYKASTGKSVNITSAVRSPEEQAKLYADYQAGKSKYPVAPPGRSKHDRGLAVDVDSSIANQLDSMGLLAKFGLGRPVAGDPVHIEYVSAATGGAFSGPKSGFPAVLHGNEAVVPMADENQIPTESTGLDDTTEKQTNFIRQQNQIINQIIAAARSNNDANKRLMSLKAS